MPKTQTQIVPAADVAAIRRNSSLPVQKAEALIVKSPDDENLAYTILTSIKGVRKNIEKRRKEITAPLNKSLKAANAMFKELDKPLKDADTILRDKVLVFHEEQEARAAAEQKRREKIQQSHEDRGHETRELAPVEADVGESVTVKRWAIRITDATKIPEKILRKLMQTDDGYEVMGKWLRAQMREAEKDSDGRPLLDIPGTEVFQDKGLRV